MDLEYFIFFNFLYKLQKCRRVIFFEEGKFIADQKDFLFLETSAKTGDNVEEVWDYLFFVLF